MKKKIKTKLAMSSKEVVLIMSYDRNNTSLKDLTNAIIDAYLGITKENVVKTAKLLKISKQTVYNKLKSYLKEEN